MSKSAKYVFEARIGIDDGLGNDYSPTQIELDGNFSILSLTTQFVDDEGEDEGGVVETYIQELSPEQHDCLRAAIEGFRAGLEQGMGKSAGLVTDESPKTF